MLAKIGFSLFGTWSSNRKYVCMGDVCMGDFLGFSGCFQFFLRYWAHSLTFSGFFLECGNPARVCI
jgi:hypothetical protein